MMPLSRNVDLARTIIDAVDMMNLLGHMLSDVDLPAEEQMMEAYDILEDMLRKLGVLVPERVLDFLPETCEEVTDGRIAEILRALPFGNRHAALAAQEQVKELRLPLKRLVRAARIHRAVALASVRSYKCRDRLGRATLDCAVVKTRESLVDQSPNESFGPFVSDNEDQ